MKSRCPIVFSLLISLSLYSQDLSLKVVSAQGGFDAIDSMTLEWTLGEPFVETLESSKNILTQGFHQSFDNAFALGVSVVHSEFKSTIFPNPVDNLLNIRLNSTENSRLNASLYEMTGRFIKQTSVNATNSNIAINVADLSSGTYILKLSNSDNSIMELHKIIKY